MTKSDLEFLAKLADSLIAQGFVYLTGPPEGYELRQIVEREKLRMEES